MSGKLAWGYYPTTGVWLPIKVDATGRLQVDMSAVNLGDLANVDLTGLADDDFLYYDLASGLWKPRKLVDADIPSTIARDAEVVAAVAAEATARIADVDAEEAARIAAIAALKFTDLADTPAAYTGQALKVPRVNSGATALEFAMPSRWQLVDDHYFSESCQSYTVSGLNGNVDIQYLITVFNINDSGVTSEIVIRPNNDSGSNYPRQYLYAEGASIVAGADTVTGFYAVRAPADAISFDPLMCLHAVSGQNRVMFGFRHTISRWLSYTAEWNNTTDNITSLVFAGLHSNVIGAGSRYTIWKRV